MILDMAWNHDKTYMFTSSVDKSARSWMPEMGGDEVREFGGATRSTTLVKVQGEIRKEGGEGNVKHTLVSQTQSRHEN